MPGAGLPIRCYQPVLGTLWRCVRACGYVAVGWCPPVHVCVRVAVGWCACVWLFGVSTRGDVCVWLLGDVPLCSCVWLCASYRHPQSSRTRRQPKRAVRTSMRCIPVCLSVFLSVFLSFCLSVCLSVCLYGVSLLSAVMSRRNSLHENRKVDSLRCPRLLKNTGPDSFGCVDVSSLHSIGGRLCVCGCGCRSRTCSALVTLEYRVHRSSPFPPTPPPHSPIAVW
jgi:hypothetical protein